jgi:hypothetical protein
MQRIQYHRYGGPEEMRLETYELSALGEYVHDPRRSRAPVQAPTNISWFINLKIAEAFGLAVTPMLVARADEVIEYCSDRSRLRP